MHDLVLAHGAKLGNAYIYPTVLSVIQNKLGLVLVKPGLCIIMRDHRRRPAAQFRYTESATPLLNKYLNFQVTSHLL